jgi:beta-mannosidase
MSTFLTGFELAQAGTDDWIPAVVPGGVHESLLAAGRIEHPYYGDNEAKVRWVEDQTWCYRGSFDTVKGERVWLIFHGLDTVVKIWLNGEPLGEHTSQFRPAEFDVTDRLLDHNELLLRFSPPLQDLTAPASVTNTVEQMKKLFGALADPDGEPSPGVLSANLALTLRRKATFSWGWDFAPRLPSAGICGPVELRSEARAVLTGHHVRAVEVNVEAKTARVKVDLEASESLTATVTLTSPAGVRTESIVKVGETSEFVVDQAQLWWTHDLGEPALYDVRIDLRAADGTVLDSRKDRIGLRTISLDRSADESEGGRFFRFVLNGIPVFARGANWIPADMLVGSVTPQTCHALVEKARQANMTMLRVWGGGIYEQDAFYDACDEAGVLVWQDFMFACIDYPSDDPVLRAEVTQEAAYQVRRLRNHPALALWCGNNEVHAIHGLVYRDLGPGGWGYGFFHEILPDAVSRFSPEIPYWPGSPWGQDDPRGVNGVLDGDRHAWEVWHGVDVGAGGPSEFGSHGEAVHFHRYAYDHGKFISEFGIHAAPELATLRRWTPDGSLALHSPEFDHRNKDVPKNKGDDLMSVETGLPRDLAQYVDFSMAAQAEGLKFGIEHYRRRQPHTSGTLIWQLNDPWPGLSWSVIDHDLVPKAGYYFVQRAYEPVLASFVRTADGGVELWLTNSLPTPVSADLLVEIATFAGKGIVDARVRTEVSGLSSAAVWSAGPEAVQADRYARVSDETGKIATNRLFFAPLKDLDLGSGHVETQITRGGDDAVSVELVSYGYNYLTRITAPVPGVTFSSNYFDLVDGERRTVQVSGLPKGSELQVGWYGYQP